jgi:hypothetical protein
MARERYGNGYRGWAATRRKMHANFRGFAEHSPRSLKPVHGRVGGLARRRAGFGERLASFVPRDW